MTQVPMPIIPPTIGQDNLSRILQSHDVRMLQLERRVGGQGMAYVPTLTGMTVGASSILGRYVLSGPWCLWSVVVTLGAGAAFVGGAPTVSLPLNRNASLFPSLINVDLVDVSAAVWKGNGYFTGASGVQAYASGTAGGAAGSFAIISATGPFTWVVGDRIEYSGIYEW